VIASKVCFDSRECEFYGVEIGGIGWEKFAAHAPILKSIMKKKLWMV